MRRVFALAFLFTLLAAAPLSRAQQLTPLRLPWDQWQLHDGNDPSCALPVAPSCTVKPLAFDDWGQLNSWQRIEVTLPPLLQSQANLSILIQGDYPTYDLYINGQRVGSSGDLAHRTGPQYSRVVFPIPPAAAASGHLVLAIHSLGLDTSNLLDGFDPTIAPADQIQSILNLDTYNYLSSSWLHYLCFFAMFAVGIVFLLLYGINTRAREHLWLALRLCSLLLFRLCELAEVVNLHISANQAQCIQSTFNGLGAFFQIEFVFCFLGKPVPKAFRVIQVLAAFNASALPLILPLPAALYFSYAVVSQSVVLHHIGLASTLLSALTMLLILPACFKSRLPEMRWIGAATLFLVLEESNRMAGFIQLPHLSQDIYYHGIDIDLRAIANLLFATVMLVAMTFRLRRIQDRNRRVEQELAAARSVQQILIPDQLPAIPGLAIETAYIPAQEVGGDFFQVLPIPNSTSAFIVLGDVSGKGLPAAMTVSLLVGALRTAAETCTTPAQLLSVLNRRLHGRSEGFATCLALLVTPTGHVTVANAGHPSPYLNGNEIETDPNLPLGLAPEISYTETTLQVLPGQRLTLVTDGVVEATSTTHELFGFERTQSVSIQPAASIAKAAQDFGLGAPQADDITVLTLALA